MKTVWQDAKARRMLGAILMSSLGFGLNVLALGQVLFELTGSTQAFVTVLASQGIGAICVLPFCGPLVDALSSTRVYIAAAAAKAACVLTIVGITVAHIGDPVPFIMAAAVLLAVFDNVERAALFKFTAHHISKSAVVKFNAVNGMAFQVGVVIGMALLGVVLAYGSPTKALLLSVCASAACALVASRVRLEKSENTRPLSAALLRTALLGLLGDWRQMFRQYRGELVVFAMVVTCTADFLFANSMSTLVVPLVDRFYDGRSWYISVLEATFGTGMITASFFTSRTAKQRLLPVWLAVQAAAALLLSRTGEPVIHFAAFLVAGFANLNSLVWLLASLQQHAGEGDKAKMASLRLLAIGLGSVVLMPFVGQAAKVSLGTGYVSVAAIMLLFALGSVWVAARFRPRVTAG
ncbi:MFS transporter [Streptomyces sp. NPDC021096]|uniref:MFS transporter n=1 Tax=Streptomyces sp. NPDC021096 TaxID=3154792 RepID=UPI0033CDAC79